MNHRRSQGVPPQGGEKILGIIYSKNLQVHPQHTKCTPRQSKSQFLDRFLLGGGDLEVYLVDLDRLLKAATKRSTFLRRKVHPRQNPGYAYAMNSKVTLCKKLDYQLVAVMFSSYMNSSFISGRLSNHQ